MTPTRQLYFDDPLTLEFTAQVTESRPLDGGRFGLVMPRTYFYPTSGGQEHDTGIDRRCERAGCLQR